MGKHMAISKRTATLLLLVLFAPTVLCAQEWLERPYDREIQSSLEEFRDRHPDVTVFRDLLGRTILYGNTIERGRTHDEAVNRFLAQHAVLFGVYPDDLELIFEADLLTRPGTVYAYRQVIDGIPVEYSAFRLLVRPDLTTGLPSVVYAAGHLALEPVGGYAPLLLTGEEALQQARREVPGIDREHWVASNLIIAASATNRSDSQLLYRVRAIDPDPLKARDLSVFVDPETGKVVEVRDEICQVDVEGEVRGRVNVNNLPDAPSNPAVEMGLEYVPVAISGSGSTTSADDGSFTCPHSGTAPVSLSSNLVGDWVRVLNEGGSDLLVNTPATPPGPATVQLNPVANAITQAEVNAFHFTNVTHDFYRDRTAAGNPGIDISITCNVNILDTCNAFFSPGAQSINFFQAGGGCVNTAYSSVVAHEYGHFVVNRLGLSQGGFGEGFGDLLSMLILDDPIIGRDFLGPGTQVRNPVAANIQYPCSSTSVHTCGQILGSSFWKIRENFGSTYGSAQGLEQVQQLFVDWSLVTIGGSGDSSAHPQTSIEVLTIDDDDSSIDNGTPNFGEICSAFAEHSIDCPQLPDILFSYPVGLPEFIEPQTARLLRLQVVAGVAIPDSSSGQLFVRQGSSGPFSSYPVMAISSIDYEASLPGQDCGEPVQYYFRFLDTAGGVHTSPLGGAGDPFAVEVSTEQLIVIDDDFEADQGWSGGVPTDNATTGVWARVNPVGTVAQPGADHSEPGTVCWVTGQGSVGGAQGENDVDGGATTLLSPVFDLTGSSTPGVANFEIEYWRWYVNGTGASPYSDTFVIEISNDLVNWILVEEVGPQQGPDTTGGWIHRSFDPSELISLTSTVQMRFIAADLGAGSIVEAAIDDFRVISSTCESGPLFRRGDSNGDGNVDISDTVNILAYLFSGANVECLDAADIFDTGDINISDAVALVSYLFSSGNPPAAPYPQCGTDVGLDTLSDCISPQTCP